MIGWSSSVIMSLGKAPGAAVRSWGSKLLRFYGKEPALSRADFISTHLGFDTDNGARPTSVTASRSLTCKFHRVCRAVF